MQTCQVEEEAVLGEADPDERRVCIDRLRKAIEELRELQAKVHQCAERSRLVNALAEARRAAEDLSQSLPVGRDPSELRGTLPGILPSGGSEAATGERRPGAAPEGISSGAVSVDLKRLVREFYEEIVRQGRRGEIHEQICMRLANHDRPPNVKWGSLPWPKALDRYPKAVRTWISKAIHQAR